MAARSPFIYQLPECRSTHEPVHQDKARLPAELKGKPSVKLVNGRMIACFLRVLSRRITFDEIGACTSRSEKGVPK